MVTIRDATAHDYHACRDIIPDDWRRPSLEARLGRQLFTDKVFVAVDDSGSVVGFLVCDTDFFDADGVYLRTLLVKKDVRRQGIGGMLVRHAGNYFCARGARRIFGDAVNDVFGNKMVEKGFEKSGEIKHMHAEDVTYSIYSIKCSAVMEMQQK